MNKSSTPRQQRRPAAVARFSRSKGPGRLTLFIFFGLLPAAWVTLTPPITLPEHPVLRTRSTLATDNRVLHAYAQAFHRTPASLNTLRTYALATKQHFETYDAYGQRLDYVRLDDHHYLLRSFGEDQIENSLSTPPDMGIVRWGARPEHSFSYEYPETPNPELFPAALLPAADSADHLWLARLFVDQVGGTRQLVVRHRQKHGLFMVAAHDSVEEFLWLPSSKQIVFTATASSRHRDGIFLWNLSDNSLIDLADAASQSEPLSPAHGGSGMWLALAGVSRSGPTVYAWQHPRHDGALDPAEFFTDAQLIGYTITDPPGAGSAGTGREGTAKIATQVFPPFPAAGATLAQQIPGTDLIHAGPALPPPPLNLGLRLRSHLQVTGGVPTQQLYARLPLEGGTEEVLLAWHSFLAKTSGSPLYPYGLWILSGLYGESYVKAGAPASKEAEILRSYGSEIAKALLNYPMAPSYLRGLALYNYENLMEGRPLPYQFGNLSGGTTHDK